MNTLSLNMIKKDITIDGRSLSSSSIRVCDLIKERVWNKFDYNISELNHKGVHHEKN